MSAPASAAPFVKVRLTISQFQMLEPVLKVHREMGDCSTNGLTVVFTDYEGLQAVLNEAYSLPHPTTNLYRTWDAVINKLNAAARALAGGGKG